MAIADLTTIPEGARLYLVPSLPVWGDQKAIRLGQGGLAFRAFRLIIRHPGTPATRLYDDFILADSTNTLNLPNPLDLSLQRQLDSLQASKPSLSVAGLEKNLSFTKPLIMGVLNVTPDSFSDGGDFIDPDAAVQRARQMIAEGADIIDIGGESTRPGAEAVWEGEEADRIIPVIQALCTDGIAISVDTRRSTVMQQALSAGAHIINDVSALTYDADSMSVAAATDAPLILMHSKGESKDEHDYGDVLLDVYDYLEDRINACEAAGIDRRRIIVDPGIGFGKRVVEDNMVLMNNLSLFHTLGCPVLLGASRKRFIGAITSVTEAKDRVTGSVTAALKGVEQGVQIIRVHDVRETKEAFKMLSGLQDHALLDQPGLRQERLEG